MSSDEAFSSGNRMVQVWVGVSISDPSLCLHFLSFFPDCKKNKSMERKRKCERECWVTILGSGRSRASGCHGPDLNPIPCQSCISLENTCTRETFRIGLQLKGTVYAQDAVYPRHLQQRILLSEVLKTLLICVDNTELERPMAWLRITPLHLWIIWEMGAIFNGWHRHNVTGQQLSCFSIMEYQTASLVTFVFSVWKRGKTNTSAKFIEIELSQKTTMFILGHGMHIFWGKVMTGNLRSASP